MNMMNKACMIACAALLMFHAVVLGAGHVEVTVSSANMRAEPDNAASVTGSIPGGVIVPVIEERGSWYRVRHNNREGWVFNRLVRPVQTARAEEIFTKQDVSMLPPVPAGMADEEKPQAQRYAQVTVDNTLILEYLDPNAPFLHKARRGEVFVLIGEGQTFGKVKLTIKRNDEFVDTAGWIRLSNIERHDTPPDGSNILAHEAKIWLIIILVIGVAALAISGFATYRHIREERLRNVYIRKNALILAREPKQVTYTLTNAKTAMERCFTEIGFNVGVAKDSINARNTIEREMPDIILVDWNFEPSIFTKIDNLFARMTTAAAPYFLFYNVPDPSAVPPAKALKHVSLLGLTVSDRDIFKVVTPLLVHHEAESPKNVQKSVQRCALEGQIQGENLLEVLQFIEIGSKTGCLMVETKGPFGLVYFRDGMIVYAAAEKGQGVEAVYAILNQPSGKFRFITNKQPKVANLCLPTLSVLMEWTKEKDEARKA